MKVKFVILAIGLALFLGACTSNSETVNSTKQMTTSIEESLLFNDVFAELSTKIGIMTYNDCLSYLDKSGFVYEKTDSTEYDIGNILVTDNNGFKLTISFYPNEDNEQTITLISYSNGDYAGSVQDTYHSKAISYGIYDVTAETRNNEVSSLKEIQDFMFYEVPLKIEKYKESTANNKEIQVTLDPSYKVRNGKVYFTVNTNLPDNTELMLTLSNETYEGQTKITVVNGVATSEAFSNNGKSLKGNFTLKISMPLPDLQDDSVTAIIGTQGEFLTGEYVKPSEFSDEKIVSGTFEFDF